MSLNPLDRYFLCDVCWDKRMVRRRMSQCIEHCLPMSEERVASIERECQAALQNTTPEDWNAILGYEGPPEREWDESIVLAPYPDWTGRRWRSFRRTLKELKQ